MENIEILKERYEKGQISQTDLTKEQRIHIGIMYDKEIVQIKNDIKEIDNEIEIYKNKLLDIIERIRQINNNTNK